MSAERLTMSAEPAARESESSESNEDESKPVACIVIGMAGSGKTTLMHRLHSHLYKEDTNNSYLINLDPAVLEVPFGVNIDIRDTVNYKEVMKQYNLGPNGGILTSLNLFATRFDQVIKYAEKRSSELRHVLVDTPGQIEIFTWSASGAIITESLASSFPTVIVYVVDTPRCSSPTTFMSNMLYACSIMYKTKLPMVLCFNKTDILSHEFAMEWMTDVDKFQEAIEAEKTYLSSLTHSMSLVLDEFYQTLQGVGVSAATGDGVDDFFAAVDRAAAEYHEHYRPELDRKIAANAAADEERREAQLDALRRDAEDGAGGEVVLSGPPLDLQGAALDEDEDEDEEAEAKELAKVQQLLKES